MSGRPMKIERNSFGTSSDSGLKGTGMLYLVKNMVPFQTVQSGPPYIQKF